MMDKKRKKYEPPKEKDIGAGFLDEVTEQIAYKPIRPSIRRELEEHLLDRMEDYENEGMSREEAQRSAVRDMGDAVIIGTKLNEIHSIRKIPGLHLLTVILSVIGFLFAGYMQWTPEQEANGSYYYWLGMAAFFLVSWKGYPLFVRNWKKIAPAAAAGYLLLIGISQYTYSGVVSVRYWGMIFLVPMLTMVLYDSRRMKRSGKYLVLLLGCALPVLSVCMSRYMNPTAKMIFWLSLCGTIYFMIHRNVISGSKKAAYTAASLWTILFGLTFLADPGQEERMRTFIEPESMIHSTWDDAYNGSLIQELLSETPWIGGLELSQEELMNYGTGAWYFADRDERKIAYRIPENETDEERQIRKDYEKQLREAGILQRYIWYDVSDVTLWDILPQHYHNNYIIAVTMFLFGKIPGIIMIAVAVAYFVRLLSCIQGIQGKLAASLSFGCWQCLIWQCIFYVLGNLGYQYAAFPNMPMLSEGRVSVVFNMFMLGMILSAYRYDRVVEESGVSDDQKDLERMRYKRRVAAGLAILAVTTFIGVSASKDRTLYRAYDEDGKVIASATGTYEEKQEVVDKMIDEIIQNDLEKSRTDPEYDSLSEEVISIGIFRNEDINMMKRAEK